MRPPISHLKPLTCVALVFARVGQHRLRAFTVERGAFLFGHLPDQIDGNAVRVVETEHSRTAEGELAAREDFRQPRKDRAPRVTPSDLLLFQRFSGFSGFAKE